MQPRPWPLREPVPRQAAAEGWQTAWQEGQAQASMQELCMWSQLEDANLHILTAKDVLADFLDRLEITIALRQKAAQHYCAAAVQTSTSCSSIPIQSPYMSGCRKLCFCITLGRQNGKKVSTTYHVPDPCISVYPNVALYNSCSLPFHLSLSKWANCLTLKSRMRTVTHSA